jgi:hypothetical protein
MRVQSLDKIQTVVKLVAEFRDHCRETKECCDKLDWLFHELLGNGTKAGDFLWDIVRLLDLRHTEQLRDGLSNLLEYLEEDYEDYEPRPPVIRATDTEAAE